MIAYEFSSSSLKVSIVISKRVLKSGSLAQFEYLKLFGRTFYINFFGLCVIFFDVHVTNGF